MLISKKTVFQAKVHLDRIREIPRFLPQDKQLSLTVKDVKKGGYLSYDKEIWKVKSIHRYLADGDEWFELELVSVQTGKSLYMEWEEDDRIEISVTLETIPLSRFSPLSVDLLDEMDDEEEGGFHYNGKYFSYEESDKAKFFKDCEKEGEKYYYWDFSDNSETTFISVEKWGGREYQVHLSKPVHHSEIQVLHPGD